MTYHASLPRPAPQLNQNPAYVAITLRLADASDDLLVRQVRLLRDCVALSQQRWSFTIEAAAVLPNEMQLLCSFPDAEFGVNGAIRLIASAFDRHIPQHEGSVWSDKSEVIEVPTAVISSRRTFIEAAPVRAGLVKCAIDWPYSSANLATAQASDMGVAVA